MDATAAKYSTTTREGRLNICAALDVWLDGNPAKIVGASCDYATVIDLSTGADYQWAWGTVESIMNRDRRFKS